MINVYIQEINFFEGYKIELCLSNQHRIVYDMTFRIKTARFLVIKDPDIFKQAKIINGKIIRWANNVEVSLEEIMIQIVGGTSFREKKCIRRGESRYNNDLVK